MIEWLLPLDFTNPNKKFWKISPRIQAGINAGRNKSNGRRLALEYAITDPKPIPPCVITIQRMYDPSLHEKRWDNDNWISACKHIRDSLADLIVPGLKKGQADHPKHGLTFEYDQVASTKKGVLISIKSQQEWALDELFKQSQEWGVYQCQQNSTAAPLQDLQSQDPEVRNLH